MVISKTIGVLAAVGLPFLIWMTFLAWRDGKISLSDEANKITDHFTREQNRIKYWSHMTFYFILILGFAALVALAFLPKN